MITIKPLQQKDYNKAIQFAIKGMRFEQYISNPFLQQVYARFFFYTELNRATHVLAAYQKEELMGILLQTKLSREWALSFYMLLNRKYQIKKSTFIQIVIVAILFTNVEDSNVLEKRASRCSSGKNKFHLLVFFIGRELLHSIIFL